MNEFKKLPKRVQTALVAAGYPEDNVLAVLRTAFKPNATIPIIWLVALRHELLLCNTHATRWVWRRYSSADLNCVRTKLASLGAIAVEILSNDLNVDELTLPIPLGTAAEEVQNLVDAANAIRAHPDPLESLG